MSGPELPLVEDPDEVGLLRRMAGWRLKVQPQEAAAAERLASRGLLVIDRDMFGLVTWAEATAEGRRISKSLNDERRRQKARNFGRYSAKGGASAGGGPPRKWEPGFYEPKE